MMEGDGAETSKLPRISPIPTRHLEEKSPPAPQNDRTSRKGPGRPKGSAPKRRGRKSHPGKVPYRRRLSAGPKRSSTSSRKVGSEETALKEFSPEVEGSVSRNTPVQTYNTPCLFAPLDINQSDDLLSDATTCKVNEGVSPANIQSVLTTPNFHDYATASNFGLSTDVITPLNLPAMPTASASPAKQTTTTPTTVTQTASSPHKLFTAETEQSFNKSDLLKEARSKLEFLLDTQWKVHVNPDGLQVVMLSAQDNLAIQRSIACSSKGKIDLHVHCQPICVNRFLKYVQAVPLLPSTFNQYVGRLMLFVNEVKMMEVCSGCDDEDLKAAWNICPLGEVDKNPYRECRFTETFRSLCCSRLVKMSAWRCNECAKLKKFLKKRCELIAVNDPHPNTPNIFLSEEQKLKKLQDQALKLSNARRQISRLREKIQTLIEKEGVSLDTELSDSFIEILRSNAITPAQSVFLQEQIKASQRSKGWHPTGMRWHPTMIRLALSLHVTSPAAYELLRNTGMVKLPSSRTLFDYGRVKPLQEGIDEVILESLGKASSNFKHQYQKYHVLMSDEMHISQNLVFQKSTGQMVGYTSLDDVDKEVENLENFLNGVAEDVQEPSVAQNFLVYMVKGVSSGIKEVVATYAVANVSVSQMYFWTWEVIGALQRRGIAVIAFVCDGFSVNRAFIKMHKPVTILQNGLIFDTVNKAAPHRVLYFLSDVPHLLKTIRNCLYNSRTNGRKGRRHMKLNGQNLTWDFIIKLYETNKKKNVRKSFKLNAMNVYPDSYARMKVKLAGQILSRTVAQDLQDQDWSEASELIKFIRFVNDWFDCLNGAHTTVGKKKRNDKLLPYISEEDERFKFLLSFLDYLEKWTEQATNANISVNATGASEGNIDAEDSVVGATEEGVDPLEEDATPAGKRTLSRQTLDGVEMTTRAFIDMVKFLLKEGTEFINARVFTQDPLEQHFSKVRAGQGGSNNPNFGQVLKRTRVLHTIGQMGMKRKRGNAGESTDFVQVTDEPMPKRRSSRVPRICKAFK